MHKIIFLLSEMLQILLRLLLNFETMFLGLTSLDKIQKNTILTHIVTILNKTSGPNLYKPIYLEVYSRTIGNIGYIFLEQSVRPLYSSRKPGFWPLLVTARTL